MVDINTNVTDKVNIKVTTNAPDNAAISVADVWLSDLSLAIGTVTPSLESTQASVTNVGTSKNAILDFVLPRGLQGIQGIQGVPGKGFPSGGLTGQLFSKASDADYDATWYTPDWLKIDGSIPLSATYSPTTAQSVATKIYVDTGLANKLTSSNIISGDNISVTTQGNNVTITAIPQVTATNNVVFQNKSINAYQNTITNITTNNFNANSIATTISDTPLNTKLTTEQAVKTAMAPLATRIEVVEGLAQKQSKLSSANAGVGISIGDDQIINNTITKVSQLQNDEDYQTLEQLDAALDDISATAPINYVHRNISASVDTTPTVSSTNLISSGGVKSYVDTGLASKADKTEIPTKVSELTNDSDFQTGTQVTTTVTNATANKLEATNIKAGTNITVSTSGNNVTINSTSTGVGDLKSDGSVPMVGGYTPTTAQSIATKNYVDNETEYTNADGCIAVGGISAGTSFSNKTVKEMFDLLLYPELYPTLTNPSATFTSTASSYYEVGAKISPTFTATFNRGSISPAYGTSGYRSGLPTAYTYTGAQLTTASSTALSNVQSISNYTILQGSQSWTCKVSYSAGDQPLSNKGNNYSTPLAAGTTSSLLVSVTGVYPWYATTSSLTTLTDR